MRVLVVSDMYPKPRDGLSGSFVHRQAVELSREGVDVRVVCPIPKRVEVSTAFAGRRQRRDEASMDGIPVTYLPYWHCPVRLSSRLEVAALSRALRPCIDEIHTRRPIDVIHAHRLFPTGYVASGIARQMGLPAVATARGSDVHTHPHRNRGIARYTRAAIRGSSVVVAVSRALARQVEALAEPAVPIRVIYNGVDAERFNRPLAGATLRRELGLPEAAVGVCTVSRLVPEKGVRELMEAFGHLAVRYEDLWLCMVGGGPLESELRSWARRRGLEGRVFLPGAVAQDAVPKWLGAADIFALPTYREGMPNVVYEAMACARPVVATNVGGIPEVVIDGVSALLVPPRRVEPLVYALDRLIESPELRQRMGAGGLSIVKARFGWRQSAAQLIALYEELIGAIETARREPSHSA